MTWDSIPDIAKIIGGAFVAIGGKELIANWQKHVLKKEDKELDKVATLVEELRVLNDENVQLKVALAKITSMVETLSGMVDDDTIKKALDKIKDGESSK